MAVTGVFACGAECGIVAAGAAGGVLHWNTVTGTVTADTGTVHGTGLRSYKFTTAAGAHIGLLRNVVSTPTIAVARFYLNFSSLPSADCFLADFLDLAGGNAMGVRYVSASTKLFAAVNAVNGATGVTVITGQWYRIDLKANAGASHTSDVQVDGTACGQAAVTLTASTINRWEMGGNTELTTANCTHFIDDLILSITSADYPIGAGQIIGLSPNGDGTHSFNLAGDFKYNNSTNVLTTATDTSTFIDEVPLTSIADFLAVVGASNVEYLEWTMADLGTDVSSVNGLEVVGAFHSASAAANKTTVRLNDGGTLSDVATDLSFGNTTISYHTKHYATAPSSGAWTKTKVDALRVRWNSSFGTVDETPVPFIDSLLLEVDYVPTTPATTSTDTGTLADNRTLTADLTPVESAVLTEAVTSETAALAVVESAILGELASASQAGASNFTIAASDQGTLGEALTSTAAASASDSSVLGEAQASALPVAATDALTLGEARTAAVAELSTDSVAMSEAITALLASVGTADSGLVTETSSASSANNFILSQSDAFSLTDARTATLALAQADALVCAQLVTGESIGATDSWHLGEVAVAEAGPTFVAQALGTVALAPAIPGIAGCDPAIPGLVGVDD